MQIFILLYDCRGFSLIDLVENATTKRKYALKRITCHSIEDQKIAIREVELTRSIKHQNVVEIIDFELKGDADIVINTISHVYILFPFFKNGSLQDHLNMRAKTKDHMAESQVLQIFVGICEGLKALHEAKPEPLAHRDLKTGNKSNKLTFLKSSSVTVSQNYLHFRCSIPKKKL